MLFLVNGDGVPSTGQLVRFPAPWEVLPDAGSDPTPEAGPDPGGEPVAEAVEIDFLSHFEIRDRQVYLLKDVVSTGVIETYLLGQLRQHGPADLKLVALLDRPALRTIDLKVDYAAFEVSEGAFVGYGLELEGQHGNLPFIGKLR